MFTVIGNASEILGMLLDGSHSFITGRLADAFGNIGKERIADDFLHTRVDADMMYVKQIHLMNVSNNLS